MAISLNTSIKQTQRLALTQNLIQSIEMLQLNTIELSDTINEALEMNPVLEETTEIDDEKGSSQVDEVSQSLSHDNSKYETSFEERMMYSDSSDQGYSKYVDDDDKKRQFIENAISDSISLTENLFNQLDLIYIKKKQRLVIEKIITSLDQSGYFKMNRAKFCEDNKITFEEFIEYKEIIKSLDPPGCCSETVEECLLKQLEVRGDKDKLLERLVKEYLPKISEYKHEEISSELQISIELLLEKINIIKTLSPYPANNYEDGKSVYIIPDIDIYYIDGEILISFNDDFIPKLKLNSYYTELVKKTNVDKKLKKYVRENINEAKFLIKNINGRKETILKILKFVMQRQLEFLKNGPGNLKPLVYADVADETGFAESTISRVATNKYVQTHWGVFPLKYFFVQKAENREGSDISSDSVLKLLKDIVKNEKPDKPFSDEEIVEKLHLSGIDIARRTVAKYRGILNIPSSTKRKRINKINLEG